MDSLSETPIYYSNLEADELDDVSADEDDGADDVDSEEEEEPADPASSAFLRNRFIRPRFERWMQAATPTYDEGAILREIFGRVNVNTRDVEVISSERNLQVDFELYGMLGQYRQCSQADPTSPVWDVSKGAFDLKANVEAELVLDGETLISSAHFAGNALRPGAGDSGGGATSSGKSRRNINKDRLSERFGTETVLKLGGFNVLLQFLGVICADPGTPCYAEVLPFDLKAAVLVVNEDAEEEPRTRSARSPKKNVQSGTGYPSVAATERKQNVGAEVRPAKPPTKDQGPARPRVGAAKSSAAPKARQSSIGKKPATAAAPR